MFGCLKAIETKAIETQSCYTKKKIKKREKLFKRRHSTPLDFPPRIQLKSFHILYLLNTL